ncbi:NUDIX domain-containing protein [bacterium]|nr:NUDIX domain-containing protein [bacterium]MBU1071785.1 NUDIX domain-containing protein [bacterium]MBU1674482.1 NUDIX domain-containing protein [bacterium]
MAIQDSAGVLIYRLEGRGMEILIVHSTAPEHLEKWSIPKGEFDPERETASSAAVREVEEEIGVRIDPAELRFLGESVYRNKRKRVHCFLWEAREPLDLVPDGHEIGAARFVGVDTAKTLLHDALVGFVELTEDSTGPDSPDRR